MLIRSKQEEFKISMLSNLAYLVFKASDDSIKFENVNAPTGTPVIYALWHGRQCSLAGIPNRKDLHILISPSNDGEMVARIVEKLGFSTIRGSKGRGGTRATLDMVNALQEGKNIAFMVDGPKGPFGKVKKGLIKIAKMSGAPIIPTMGYGEKGIIANFKSWDKYQMPIFNAKMLNNYGNPIYVPKDATKEQEEEIRQQVENTMFRLFEENKKLQKEIF